MLIKYTCKVLFSSGERCTQLYVHVCVFHIKYAGFWGGEKIIKYNKIIK